MPAFVQRVTCSCPVELSKWTMGSVHVLDTELAAAERAFFGRMISYACEIFGSLTL
jgi:hypothetical protein